MKKILLTTALLCILTGCFNSQALPENPVRLAPQLSCTELIEQAENWNPDTSLPAGVYHFHADELPFTLETTGTECTLEEGKRLRLGAAPGSADSLFALILRVPELPSGSLPVASTGFPGSLLCTGAGGHNWVVLQGATDWVEDYVYAELCPKDSTTGPILSRITGGYAVTDIIIASP